MGKTVIEVRDLWFRYRYSSDWVLRGVNLEVEESDFLLVTGPPACGKSTLCLTFNGLIPQNIEGTYRGEVTVMGSSTRDTPVWTLAQQVGIVFQDPESQFLGMTVLDDLLIGPENLGLAEEEAMERVEWALRVTRLKGLEDKSPFELSGGQKTRVAIASVLTLMPRILVLDDPLVSLDPVGKVEVMEVLSRLNREHGITIVLATHEVEEAAEYARHVAFMREGRVLHYGEPGEVFSRLTLDEVKSIFSPQCLEILMELKARGLDGARPVYVVDEAEKIIREMLMRGVSRR